MKLILLINSPKNFSRNSGELFRRIFEEFCGEKFQRIPQEILETESQNCDSTKISHLGDQLWGISREFPRNQLQEMILEKFPEKFLKESHHRWRIWGNSSLLLLGLNYKCPQWISRLSYQYFQYPTQKFPALASKLLSLFFNLILNYFIFIISFLISDICMDF